MRDRMEVATPTCAFGLRLEEDLYNRLHELAINHDISKNKIVNIALEDFFTKGLQEWESERRRRK